MGPGLRASLPQPGDDICPLARIAQVQRMSLGMTRIRFGQSCAPSDGVRNGVPTEAGLAGDLRGVQQAGVLLCRRYAPRS